MGYREGFLEKGVSQLSLEERIEVFKVIGKSLLLGNIHSRSSTVTGGSCPYSRDLLYF